MSTQALSLPAQNLKDALGEFGLSASDESLASDGQVEAGPWALKWAYPSTPEDGAPYLSVALSHTVGELVSIRALLDRKAWALHTVSVAPSRFPEPAEWIIRILREDGLDLESEGIDQEIGEPVSEEIIFLLARAMAKIGSS